MESQWNANSLEQVESTPGTQASVSFGSVILDAVGKVLTPTEVQDQPKVTWPVEEGKLYTVLMVDPDAPSRDDPKFGQWFHWGVTNIPGNDIAKGEVIAQYVGAGPPPGTGLHRYVILVYRQAGRVDYTDDKLGMSSTGRPSKNAKDIASKYNLGSPIAGACFQAQFDDYVPILYSKLG